MRRKSGRPREGGVWKHSLSLAAAGILVLWIGLYAKADVKTHWGAFAGNAIADWTGVVVAVLATKYFYETGSAESKQPHTRNPSRLGRILRNHSLTLFLAVTALGWWALYMRLNPESRWGQVIASLLSEWLQLFGLVLLTKKFVEIRSKESKQTSAR